MPSTSLNVLVGVSILVSLQFQIGASQFIQSGLCDTHCLCSPGEAVVHCNRQDKLQGVPTNLPNGVTKLYIQEGDFPSPSIINRANMTGLEQLEHLRIIYCNLQAIESKAFLGMTKLKHLDLSHNALQRLDTYTFFGLQLINLYLQEQHNLSDSNGLVISADTFDGLTADQINLRGNKLSLIRYNMFSKVNNLHRLILSDNRITHLDDGFSKHFNGQTYLLDLTSNPLECTCNLAWLASLSNEWANSLPGLNMTCLYHHNTGNTFTVLEIRRLSVDHLCPSSRIHHIEVNIVDTAKRVILDCTAVAVPRTLHTSFMEPGKLSIPTLLTNTPPEVAWQYIEGGHLREIRRLPNEVQGTSGHLFLNRTTTAASSTVRLNVSLSEEPRQYKCTTRNAVRDPQEVVVTIRGPATATLEQRNDGGEKTTKERRNKLETNSISSLPSNTAGSSIRKDLLFTESHYLLQPQFSLIQMALAVGGTFLTTLILLFIGARCLHAFRPHTMFRLTSSTSSINAADGKVVYHPGVITSPGLKKSESSPRPNGTDNSSRDNGHNPTLQRQPQPYPHLIFSGIDNRNTLSPQFAHLANLQNNYLQSTILPTGNPPHCSPENFSSSLAHLVSSPLLHQNNALHQVNHSDIPMSPCLPNFHPTQNHLTYWPVSTVSSATAPPGSPYSIAGSHEYDVPRVLEMPSWNPMGTVNRTNVANLTDAGCDFRLNQGTKPM